MGKKADAGFMHCFVLFYCVFFVCKYMTCTVYTVCDQKENSGRNRNGIAIIWPEPDQHPTKLARFGRILNQIWHKSSSSVVLINTIICNCRSTIS